jgi:hypothetical protein
MNWTTIAPGRQKAGPYTIQRQPDYRYALSHQDEGELRKYKTPWGAHRAALRHQTTTQLE